jgi:EAL domain-containing protein (putative c-di-GMP-specific phosphodiesterase class I)
VRISQSFVGSILTGPENEIAARAVIRLAHKLGFTANAESVETDTQRDFLVRHGGNNFQAPSLKGQWSYKF